MTSTLEVKISNDRTLALVVAAAAGAFAYHLYAKVSVLEQMVTQEGGHRISLSSLLDMATTQEEDTEEEPPVGFSSKSGKLRKR